MNFGSGGLVLIRLVGAVCLHEYWPHLVLRCSRRLFSLGVEVSEDASQGGVVRADPQR